MGCIGCGSAAVSEWSVRTAQGYRRFRCRTCGKQFNERTAGSLNRTQYPSDVIALVVLWRLRYKLALRDLPEMFLIRGVVFSHEAVRDWETKLAPGLAESLRRRRRGKVGRSWHVDETYIKVHGQWRNLYRAIDRLGGLVVFSAPERHDRREGVLGVRQDGHRYNVRPGHHGWARQLSTCDPDDSGRRCAASGQPVSQ
jgi:putative transposase